MFYHQFFVAMFMRLSRTDFLIACVKYQDDGFNQPETTLIKSTDIVPDNILSEFALALESSV